jgi:hypothetical protein
VTLICVAFIGESTRAEHRQAIEAQRPKPTPQMMAPRPAPSDSGRASYALIDSSHVGTGWTNN